MVNCEPKFVRCHSRLNLNLYSESPVRRNKSTGGEAETSSAISCPVESFHSTVTLGGALPKVSVGLSAAQPSKPLGLSLDDDKNLKPKTEEPNSLKGIHSKVFEDRIMDLELKNVCNVDCPNKRQCVLNVRYGAIVRARKEFWGTEDSEPMSRSEHNTTLRDLIKKSGQKQPQKDSIEYIVSTIFA